MKLKVSVTMFLYRHFVQPYMDRYMRNKILDYYTGREKEFGVEKEIAYLKDHIPHIYLDSFPCEYRDFTANILKDRKCGLYYVIHKGKRMYFKRSFSKKEAFAYYRDMITEQDKRSPHRYFDDELNGRSFGKVIDIGGAEGIFSLEIIDRCDKVYICECDGEWLEALKETFRPYKSKVKLINAFISDRDEGREVTLDKAVFKGKYKDIDLIKMDIEGAEPRAVKGAKALLKANPQAQLLLCVYHNSSDEETLKGLLEGYIFECRSGKMCWPDKTIKIENGRILTPSMHIKPPYITNGVMKAYRNDI